MSKLASDEGANRARQMSELRLRMIELQAMITKLNTELGLVQQQYSDMSYSLWLDEQGYKIKQRPSDLTDNDVSRLLRLAALR